jgi:hypothetical protein
MSCWYLLLCDEYRLKRCQWSLPALYDLFRGCELGTVNPVECGLGSYSDSNAQSCTPCPGRILLRQQYHHFVGTIVRWWYLEQCCGSQWGMFQRNLLSRRHDPCPRFGSGCMFRRYYCPSGASIPLPCSRRIQRLRRFLLDFIQFLALAFTGMCEPGHYCPAQSTGPKQVPCPARSYRPEYGGASPPDDSANKVVVLLPQ